MIVFIDADEPFILVSSDIAALSSHSQLWDPSVDRHGVDLEHPTHKRGSKRID